MVYDFLLIRNLTIAVLISAARRLPSGGQTMTTLPTKQPGKLNNVNCFVRFQQAPPGITSLWKVS